MVQIKTNKNAPHSIVTNVLKCSSKLHLSAYTAPHSNAMQKGAVYKKAGDIKSLPIALYATNNTNKRVKINIYICKLFLLNNKTRFIYRMLS